MDALWRDLRAGARALARSPGFTAVAIISLALGIGVNSAVFSIVYSTVVDILPWKDPERIVVVYETRRSEGEIRQFVSSAKYVDWKDQVRSYDGGLVATSQIRLNLTDGDDLVVVNVGETTANAFSSLGLRMQLGRGFHPSETELRAGRVAILSHQLWQRRYESDPQIVGSSIEIDGQPVPVVGVLGESEWFPFPDSELVTPLVLDPADLSRTDHKLWVWGRLAPDVSLEEARSEMAVIAQRLSDHYGESDVGWSTRVDPAGDALMDRSSRSALILMMGAVSLVLLIACANVANMQLARGAARTKEFAIRGALGGSRTQIARQLLAESLVLALLALPFALLVTRWVLDFAVSVIPPAGAYMETYMQLDASVLLFAALVSLATVLLFGLSPAITAARTDVHASLKHGGDRGSSATRGHVVRSTLVVGQIALALCLLLSSGLLIQRFVTFQSSDPGFRSDHLLVTALALPDERYPEAPHWRSFQADLRSRLEAMPGVEGTAFASSAPSGFGGGAAEAFAIRGRPPASKDEMPTALWTGAGLGYFDVLGIRLLEGRRFDETDRGSGVSVAIINRTLATRYFGGESPLGQWVVFSDGQEREIVGVVSDVVQWSLASAIMPHLYEPAAQRPSADTSIIVRTSVDPLSLAPALRREVRGIDPLLPVLDVESMEQRLRSSLWPQRFFLSLMTLLAGVALVLASVGIYGLMSYSTSRRTVEFGIRSALGADQKTVALLVIRQAAVLALLGISSGLLLGLGMGRLMASFLYGLEPFDPIAFASISLFMAALALLASAVPALRATRADPILALQAE